MTSDAKFDLRGFARRMRERWMRTRFAEKQYAQRLVAVARQCGLIVRGFAPNGRVENIEGLVQMLENYAQIIDPWARAVAGRMLEDVARRDARAWFEKSEEMGLRLREEIQTAPTGHVMQQLMAEQINEIKSIPLGTAKRVYELATESLISGRRAEDIARDVMNSGQVAESTAKMIARSAVSTASSTLTEARARHVGSDSYIWRTSKDSDVRSDHRELEGKVIRWDDPPVVDKRTGYRAHAGCNANCRCYPEPILPATF
jgi:SPP1 gp7 family putative phage head morphogenesis protein